MQDVGDRLKSYEPLWENWYKDSYIGGGNFGRVYRLKQDFFGDIRYSAVKVIPIILDQELTSKNVDRSKLISDKKNIIVQEIKNMYKLDGQRYLVNCIAYNIKDIYDDRGNVIGFDVLIQMDYYISLLNYLKDCGELSNDAIKKLALQIGEGLMSMHNINMLHRDIKVDNIYIDKKEDFLLGDFGISKQDAASSYSTMAGTQSFIAPEVWNVQYTNKRYTKTADIYSYGITMYYLLNGNMLPLTNENSSQNEIEAAVFDRLNGKSFPPPINGSEDLKAIVMKCCEYLPENRYQSMEEILRDLNRPDTYISPMHPFDQSTDIPKKADSFEKSKSNDFQNRSVYQTMYAGNETYEEKEDSAYRYTPIGSGMNLSQVNYTETNVAGGKQNRIIIGIISTISIVAVLVMATLMFFVIKNSDKEDNGNTDKNMVVADTMQRYGTEVTESNEDESSSEAMTTTTTATTTTITTTTPTTTAVTTKTPEKSADAVKNNYEELKTTLIVKVDEAGTLPLRSTPDKSDNIILRIPDETQVQVLGYREQDTEVWFRVEYDGSKGWVRGGMLQPNNLSMLYDEVFDIPALEKWKNKFYLQTPNSYLDQQYSCEFKGTLYFIPSFSSGVQRRFKQYTDVTVMAKDQSGEWYYVSLFSGNNYYEGWVYNSHLSS